MTLEGGDGDVVDAVAATVADATVTTRFVVSSSFNADDEKLGVMEWDGEGLDGPDVGECSLVAAQDFTG